MVRKAVPCRAKQSRKCHPSAGTALLFLRFISHCVVMGMLSIDGVLLSHCSVYRGRKQIAEGELFHLLARVAEAHGMPMQERTDLATELKLAGNKAYGERKFVDAVRYYSRAIEVSPAPEPVFFSNRAASESVFRYTQCPAPNLK